MIPDPDKVLFSRTAVERFCDLGKSTGENILVFVEACKEKHSGAPALRGKALQYLKMLFYNSLRAAD